MVMIVKIIITAIIVYDVIAVFVRSIKIAFFWPRVPLSFQNIIQLLPLSEDNMIIYQP